MTPARRILIGGVGYRWQRDASFGLLAADALAREAWPPSIAVEDLGYGAIFVAEDLAAAKPPWDALILLAAAERGRTPGRVYRYVVLRREAGADEIQARIREAGAGVIDLDHLLVIGARFGALPPHVVVYEAEPLDTAGGEGLSPELERRFERVLAAVREEALEAGSGPTRARHRGTPGGGSGANRLAVRETEV